MYWTVIGVVVPANWAVNNHITSVSIQGTDEMEYRVAGGPHLQGLIALCGRRVRVRGEVEMEAHGARMRVRDYELIS